MLKINHLSKSYKKKIVLDESEILISTHILDDVSKIADKALVMGFTGDWRTYRQ